MTTRETNVYLSKKSKSAKRLCLTGGFHNESCGKQRRGMSCASKCSFQSVTDNISYLRWNHGVILFIFQENRSYIVLCSIVVISVNNLNSKPDLGILCHSFIILYNLYIIIYYLCMYYLRVLSNSSGSTIFFRIVLGLSR